MSAPTRLTNLEACSPLIFNKRIIQKVKHWESSKSLTVIYSDIVIKPRAPCSGLNSTSEKMFVDSIDLYRIRFCS